MTFLNDAGQAAGRDPRPAGGRPVPGRWAAAAYTCLMVALYAAAKGDSPPDRVPALTVLR